MPLSNDRKICVFDFETDGTNPEKCNPVQLAALILDPITLEVIQGSEFSSFMKPPEIDNLDKYLKPERKKTVDWHANNYKCKPEDVLAKWQSAPETKEVWQQFSEYLSKYMKKQSYWYKPIAAGQNIRNFDLIIADRLNQQTKQKSLFWKRDIIDLLDLCYYWFESLEEPASYNMDTLRPFFGLSATGSHDALNDVQTTAKIISRFLTFMRRVAKQTTFKNSFK